MKDLFEELEDFKYLKIRMRQEGFHYCFKHYSRFEEIEDEQFHKLRREYLESANKLEDYINTKIFELEEKIENYGE